MVYGTLFVFFLSLFHTDIHFIPPAAMIFPFLDISVSLLSSPRPPERTSDSGDSTISVSLLSFPCPPERTSDNGDSIISVSLLSSPCPPPSARQTAETAPSQSPCSHSLVPLLANEACTKQIRHASLSYSFPGYSSVFCCHLGCPWFIYRHSP